jgi:serine phosphatase RsbU (regulator of sigma subunit)
MQDAMQLKYSRRRKNFTRYSIIIIIGYAITQIGSLLAKHAGLSSISYNEILFTASVSIGLTILITLIVLIRKDLPDRFIYPLISMQFVIWLVLYAFWVYFLREARVLGLFFAFMPLIFLITSSNLVQSLSITVSLAVIQLSVSYFGIYHMGQGGSFLEAVFYTSWFVPSAIYIAYAAGTFHRQRKELRKAKQEAEKSRDALWGEMELAKKIQTVLLPSNPAMRNFQISGHLAPADEVGGDYYDIINVAGRDWVVIGDVSGHGVPAGLIMMMTQTAIKTIVTHSPDIPPVTLLSVINGVLADNVRRLGGDKYMTLTVMAMHQQGEFYFSGLHQDIMIFRQTDGSIEIQETRGMWIGIVEDLEGMNEEDRLYLNAGDVMMLYTDGVTEAVGPDGIMFGEERLQAILRENGNGTPDEIRDAVLTAMNGYKRNDDVTLLIIKRK